MFFGEGWLLGTSTVPALPLFGTTGLPAPALERSRLHPPTAVPAVSLGFPRGTAQRGGTGLVSVEGGRGSPSPHAATGLVQQPLPALCRSSSEVGMADPNLTFPTEHECPPPSMSFNSLNPAPACAPALLPFGIFAKSLRYLRKGIDASLGTPGKGSQPALC